MRKMEKGLLISGELGPLFYFYFFRNSLRDVVDNHDLLEAALPIVKVSISKLKCLLKAHGTRHKA